MNTNNTQMTRARLFSLAPAAVLLASLAGSAVQAQVIPLTAPPAGDSATTTSTFPLNDNNGGYIYGPQVSSLGSLNTVTFTATNPGVASFETFDNSTVNGAPLAYPLNTVVLNTFDGGNGHTNTVTGPLDINFSSAVSSFGLTVESAVDDTATFSFAAYDGAIASQNLIGTFTYAPVTQSEGNHQSLFIGGQATGNQIVNVVVSDTSDQSGYTGGTNDFFFGPLSTFSPVPEASTTISFGLLLMLGAGGVLIRKKLGEQKINAQKASAA